MTDQRVRAGHADRQTAVDGLARHFTDGRLEAGEFDERVGKAYAATYLDEFPELFADLPDDRPQRADNRPFGRSDQDQAGQFAPARSPWTGPQRRGHHPPRALAFIVLFAMLFSIGALAHGFFPFPLLFVGIFLILASRGRRARWAASGPRGPHSHHGRRY